MVTVPYPNRLEERMRAVGLNDPQLARRVGTTRQQIFKLRRGERQLTVAWAKRLAGPLGIDWTALIEGEATGGYAPPAISRRTETLTGLVDIDRLALVIEMLAKAYDGRGVPVHAQPRQFAEATLEIYDGLSKRIAAETPPRQDDQVTRELTVSDAHVTRKDRDNTSSD